MNTKEKYEALISDLYSQFNILTEDQVNEKPGDKWSKKEIIGHLCDSAINNIYRFMHLQNTGHVFEVIQYKQNLWVEQAAYSNRPWSELCQLWLSLNNNILHIVASLSHKKNLSVNIDDNIFSAQYLIEDYFAHLSHHANQILSHGKQ